MTDLFLLCYEFMSVQPASPSCEEVSRGVIWAFSPVVSFEINCNQFCGKREEAREGGKEKEVRLGERRDR